MDTHTNQDPTHEHANAIEAEIEHHRMKAESSSGPEKQEHMNKVKELMTQKESMLNKIDSWKEKGQSIKEKGKGYLDHLGM